MNKIIFGSLLLSAVSLMACNGNDSDAVDTSIMPAKTEQPAVNAVNPTVTDTTKGAALVNPNTVQQVVATTTGKPAATVNPAATGPLNPAHGQPGHRCEIAVGAPLSSAPAATAQPKIQQSVTAAPAVVAAPTPAAPIAPADPNVKLNPAHGQPGHDCSIAVGAPLKKN